MKAVVFLSKNKRLSINQVDTPRPSKGEVLIRLSFAALNHLDLWIWEEKTLQTPVIPGSDGSGLVVAVGEDVDAAWIGKEVVVNPSLCWGENEAMYGDEFQILGYPTNGTFAEYLVIPAAYIHNKPVHLTLEESAALPMAALTAYRILFTKTKLKASDKVLVTGIGGGVALFLLQMAVAVGAAVYVTSSSKDKIDKAVSLGAKAGYNYRDMEWVQQAKEKAGGFDVIADSAGGNGFSQLVEVANPAARIVLFGRTAGIINQLQPAIIYNKQLQIMGTVMGTPDEFKAMLHFYKQHQLRPVIDQIFPLEKMEEARDYMRSGKQFGKIIISTG